MGSEKGGVGLGGGGGGESKERKQRKKIKLRWKAWCWLSLENLEAKSGRCPFEDKVADVTFHIIRRRH